MEPLLRPCWSVGTYLESCVVTVGCVKDGVGVGGADEKAANGRRDDVIAQPDLAQFQVDAEKDEFDECE